MTWLLALLVEIGLTKGAVQGTFWLVKRGEGKQIIDHVTRPAYKQFRFSTVTTITDFQE